MAEAAAEPVAVPVEEALVVRRVPVAVPVEDWVPVEVPVEVVEEPVALRREMSVLFLPGRPVVREPEVRGPGIEGLIDTSGVEVPVVEASVSVVAVEVPEETTEVEAVEEEDSVEETVEDVPVVVAEELLASVTSNCSDWARMPVFLASVESRLIWKPELQCALSVS